MRACGVLFVLISATAGAAPQALEELLNAAGDQPQVAAAPAPKMKPVEGFQLGDKWIGITTQSKPGPAKDVVFFNLHDNEDTCVKAALTVIGEQGGTVVKLENDSKRDITFGLDGQEFTFDPNRIFTPVGLRKSLKLVKNKKSPVKAGDVAKLESAAQKKVQAFTDHLTTNYINKWKQPVVAIHNNTDGNYSISNNYKHNVFLVKGQDTDDFFLVTAKKHFESLKGLFNLTWQDNSGVTDDSPRNDGSLVIYCANNGIDYINVEAQHGHQDEQTVMLRKLVEVILAK